MAQYSFSPPGIANASASGVIVGAAAGSTVLTVSFDSQQTNVPITVESDEPEILALSIQPSLITAGIGPNELSLPFTVEATIRMEANRTSRLQVTNPINRNPDCSNCPWNLVEGISVGNTELIARFDGLQASALEISQTSNPVVFIFVSGPPTLH